MAEKMKMIFVEGTVDQVADFAKQLGMSSTSLTAPPQGVKSPAGNEDDDDDDAEYPVVTTEFARTFLNRRSLSTEQKALLAKLAEASPEWTLATELQDALSYTPAQFAGMMGAFGRRLTHTEDYVDGSWFFDQEWVDDKNCYKYRLPETVIAAVKAEKLI